MALLRSASAAGTLILAPFHSSKITGGALGALWQEFQELELLDNITALRFKGKLPMKIAITDHQNSLIASFREHKGLGYMPPKIHKAIKWNKTNPFLEWDGPDIEWAIVDRKVKQQGTKAEDSLQCKMEKCPNPLKKRKRSDTFYGPLEGLKITKLQNPAIGDGSELHQVNIPLGTQWVNKSCAYDSAITILFNIWQEDPDFVQVCWQELQSGMLNVLSDGF
ncbi:hypothetical protein L208DRAFT_1337747 [Tricholoma matsutake]|nr:hypothetical protein L208DRAFT_1337747 [Tricholoma matsutake 945]